MLAIKSDGRAEIENIEIELLLSGIYRYYGFDFRNYKIEYVKDKVLECVRKEKLRSISAYQEKILRDSKYMDRFLSAMSFETTGVFEQHSFYRLFRKKIVPILRTYPSVRIWQVGCASGEQVYSLAILLKEENLYDRTNIYATDLNEQLLEHAQRGVFPSAKVKQYSQNYERSGGVQSLMEYGRVQSDDFVFEPTLRKNIVFATHNLATDSSFNEFQVILCRNVLFCFNKTLEFRVLELLRESSAMFGFLALDRQSSKDFPSEDFGYEELDGRHKIFRKIR
jgi:chemotaxis protein methyltransferase CheR